MSNIEKPPSPRTQLKHLLSPNFYLPQPIASTPSSPPPPTTYWRQIGIGSKGVIYTPTPTSPQVYKLALKNTEQQVLWNDYHMHQLVLEAFQKTAPLLGTNIRIPTCYWYTDPNDAAFWDEAFSKIPFEDRNLVETLCTQRIPALGAEIRGLLVEEFCTPALQEQVRANDANRDCLVRMYLGKRRHTARLNPRGIVLRNFELHLDQMERLGLDVEYYARAMADTLAMLHFVARVDGDDVEIVLGGALPLAERDEMPEIHPLTSGEIEKSEKQVSTRVRVLGPNRALDSETRGSMPSASATLTGGQNGTGCQPAKPPILASQLYLLDFNQCARIPMNEDGMRQAAKSFWENSGQYFPRPLRELSRDNELWELFAEQYLKSCRKIIDMEAAVEIAMAEWHRLPGLFLREVVERRERELRGKRQSLADCKEDVREDTEG